MIDLATEQVFPLSEAPKRIPGRPSIATIFRWTGSGVGPRRIRLEVLKIGGKQFTSMEALQRFADSLTRAREGVVSEGPPAGAAAASAKRAAETARQLDAIGI
jgi:hypothetical protein